MGVYPAPEGGHQMVSDDIWGCPVLQDGHGWDRQHQNWLFYGISDDLFLYDVYFELNCSKYDYSREKKPLFLSVFCTIKSTTICVDLFYILKKIVNSRLNFNIYF